MIVSGALLLIILLYIFTPKPTIRAHIPGAYPYVKPSTPQIYAPVPNEATATPPAKKLIVKVQLEGEDLNWLLKLLPEWRNQVITIDKSFASLHEGGFRVDKGRIADAYLSWIISNYNNLAETIVFLPPNLQKQEADKGKWRLPNKDLVTSIESLKVEHVQKFGYALLHCPKKEECEDSILPFRSPPDEYRTLEVKMAKAWEQLFNNTHVPEKWGRPAGNECVVSKTQIRTRGVEAWSRYWQWLAKSKIGYDSAAAVMERAWHVIFGNWSSWCPEEREWTCEVFGRC